MISFKIHSVYKKKWCAASGLVGLAGTVNDNIWHGYIIFSLIAVNSQNISCINELSVFSQVQMANSILNKYLNKTALSLPEHHSNKFYGLIYFYSKGLR